MRIAIDIDDTIADTYEPIKLLILNHKKYNMDDYTDDIYYKHPYVYNMSKDEREKVASNLNVKDDVVSVINQLKKAGHAIYFITARNDDEFTNAYDVTYRWLQGNNILFDKLITGAICKDKICEENKIDLFFDDSIDNVVKVENKGIKSYLYTSYYNEKFKFKSRVNNWKEIEELINNL